MGHPKTNIEKALSTLEDIGKLVSTPIPQATGHENHNLQIPITVRDNSELLYLISSLLKTVVVASRSTEGLYSPSLESHGTEAPLTTVLELAIQLLPDQQMESLDQIKKLLFDLEL
ncbi:hypothetical protein [Sediminicola luteus]|uniref:Uncharacterized protein n=1 Tax=Sediminicola luteus TaxID=319238 RepID=A0A2A4G2A5_9FLAO|nr:hypothetical protein [Sediminicola luteus]PCE63109.1 hypothetical protein B7P33_17730 [Sediminicola luteus]